MFTAGKQASGCGKREDENDGRLGADYARTLVRKLFNEASGISGSDARVVCGRGGLDVVGDGRKAYLFLF